MKAAIEEFKVRPSIFKYRTAEEFAAVLGLGEGDLVLTNEPVYRPYFEKLKLNCDVLYQERYGTGEPSDEMVEAMARDRKGEYKRIIGIGGGTVIDIAKLFALKTLTPVSELYDGIIRPEKARELILVPTTCGTGSEMTNISILALTSKGTKKGLANDAMYADRAVLVPELLEKLPPYVFATSSIDALIHAVESTLSPKGNEFTRLFGYKAMEMILKGYKKILAEGEEARKELTDDFLTASCFAGIAFGNAGCAAVHALSYPLGAAFHVAHGESNYAVFMGVMNYYMEHRTDGEIAVLNRYLSDILECHEGEVYEKLEKLLGFLLPKKALHEYGVPREKLAEFADSVMENQGRLMANNFVEINREQVLEIYNKLY